MTLNPLVIIGAPRSGTNMLRDMLTTLPGIETWPCDEINYIWRHGNVRYPTDELPAELATPSVVDYIRRQFQKLAMARSAELLVEKTCANALRVGFVDRVLPEAKYVFIYRDGIDVVGSAQKRWTASLDLGYLAKKVRYVPPTDLPYYASRYAVNRMHKLLSKESRLAVWGPRISGMEMWPDQYDLLQMCALQWRTCMEKADQALTLLPPERVHRVRYESFVREPVNELSQILNFMGHDMTDEHIAAATAAVSPRSVGLGRTQLDAQQLERVVSLVAPTLGQYGYAA